MKSVGEAAVGVRFSAAEDLDFVRRLSEETFARYGDYSGILPDWLADPGVQTILAVDGSGCPVGFAMLGSRRPGSPPIAASGELLALAVVPGRRRQGIGRLLLEEVERRARAASMREIRLSTADTNVAARRLYESVGFVVLAHVCRFYPSGQSALEMTKRL